MKPLAQRLHHLLIHFSLSCEAPRDELVKLRHCSVLPEGCRGLTLPPRLGCYRAQPSPWHRQLCCSRKLGLAAPCLPWQPAPPGASASLRLFPWLGFPSYLLSPLPLLCAEWGWCSLAPLLTSQRRHSPPRIFHAVASCMDVFTFWLFTWLP